MPSVVLLSDHQPRTHFYQSYFNILVSLNYINRRGLNLCVSFTHKVSAFTHGSSNEPHFPCVRVGTWEPALPSRAHFKNELLVLTGNKSEDSCSAFPGREGAGRRAPTVTHTQRLSDTKRARQANSFYHYMHPVALVSQHVTICRARNGVFTNICSCFCTFITVCGGRRRFFLRKRMNEDFAEYRSDNKDV